MKKTKTYQNSRNYSNNTNRHFQDLVSDLVIGFARFGAPDIDSIDDLDEMGNLRDILTDLQSITFSGIGEVVSKTENISPSGVVQMDRWEFNRNLGTLYGKKTKVRLLGVDVEFDSGSTIPIIVLEIKDIIQSYIDSGKYFISVEQIDDYTLEVEYSDLREHNPKISFNDERLEPEKTILRERIIGYGQWVFLGTKNVDFGGITKDIYYYERVG